MGELFASATDVPALAAAWEQVFAKDAEDDQLSAGVRTFAGDAERRLAGLAEQLADGSYRPGTLTELVMVTKDGGQRILRVPPGR